MPSPETHVLTIRLNVRDGRMADHTIIARGTREKMLEAGKAISSDPFWHTLVGRSCNGDLAESELPYTFSASLENGHAFVIPVAKLDDFQRKTGIKVVTL